MYTGEVLQLYIINYNTTTIVHGQSRLFMCNDDAALKVQRECYNVYTYSMYQNDG